MESMTVQLYYYSICKYTLWVALVRPSGHTRAMEKLDDDVGEFERSHNGENRVSKFCFFLFADLLLQRRF